MSKILVLYASNHGHTRRIAERIARRLEQAGRRAEVRAVRDDAPAGLRGYDAVVVGASIHNGRHQREVVTWARRNADALNAMPTAFFSVCLAVADGGERSRAAAREWIDRFIDDTGWTPDTATTFAGAVQFTSYDRVTRVFMQLMMARGGHVLDTGRDHDYTDWDAVDAFAAGVQALADAAVAVG